MNIYKILVYKGLNLIRTRGISEFLLRLQEKLIYHKSVNTQIELLRNLKDEENDIVLEYNPKISIVVPIYNTKIKYLHEMIQSVLNQEYENWELCLFDGGSNNTEITRTVESYQKNNKNIIYKKSVKNYGISGNTNRALELVTGEYICLLDHDDMLATNALYDCIKVINRVNPDFIYSDEDKITDNEGEHLQPHIKSKWAPDTLKSYNYICHLVMFKKELMKESGEFRECFDGSQDFDFIIRLTRHAKCIYHIPKILYHWRISSESTALNIGVKEYAINAGKEVVNSAIKEEGLSYEVSLGKFTGSYIINGDLIIRPEITIVILGNWKTEDKLMEDYEKLLNNTTYENYKMIFVNKQYDKNVFSKKLTSKVNVINGKNSNYAQVINQIMGKVNTQYIIIKDNSIQILFPKWCEVLVSQAQEKYIGIVAPKILKNRRKIYSYGIGVTKKKIINNYGNCHNNIYGYMGRCKISQNVTAVSSKLYLIKKDVWLNIGKFNEEYTDETTFIDYCIKMNIRSYFIKLIPNELGLYKDVNDKSMKIDSIHKLLEEYDYYLSDYDYYNPIVYNE